MEKHEKIKHGLECCTNQVRCVGPQCEYYGDFPVCIISLMRDAMEYINDLEARAPRWISVSEKMPTPDTRVLASAIDNDGGSIVVITEYTHRLYGLGVTGWIEPWQYFSCNYKITHWMTLPEAQEEG